MRNKWYSYEEVKEKVYECSGHECKVVDCKFFPYKNHSSQLLIKDIYGKYKVTTFAYLKTKYDIK